MHWLTTDLSIARIIRIGLLGAAMSVSTNASSQVIDMSGFVNSINLQSTSILGDEVNREIMDGAMGQGGNSGRAFTVPLTGATGSSDVVANPAILTFSPSQKQHQANIDKYFGLMRQFDAKNAAQLRDQFTSMNVFATIERGMAQDYGLDSNNVADCIAMWWAYSWNYANLNRSEPSRAAVRAVSKQVAASLANSVELANASDTDKQELADEMLLRMVMLGAGVEQHGSDPASFQAIADAIKQGARASGYDFDSMTLTERGFVPARRRRGAVDPAAPPTSDAPQRLAASDAPTQPSLPQDQPMPYALIAAAGGAGLGAVFLLGKVTGRRG